MDNDGRGTTNLELEEEAKNITNFRGVFMRDELNKLKILNNECGIVNLKPSWDNNGHWCCWYKNGNAKYYFDSFGVRPPKEVIKYLKSPIMFSTFQIQTFNESNCGEWCIYVLKKLSKGEYYTDVIADIVNGRQN